THMGTAFARPTVALFGSTCPYLETGSARTRVIYHALECSPCRRRPTCGGAFTCMRGITCDEVLTMTKDIIEIT
ncbi:MAG: glycosyltransferase family 9 protein, partial [Thiohalomonadaceae bacterium]